MFFRTELTVYPCYEGDPLTGERTKYLYCANLEGLVTPDQLKGYKVYHKSDFYYDLVQEKLIDFNALIEGLEAETATLKWIAEEKLTWFKEESEQRRQELRAIRPASQQRTPPRKIVTIVGNIADLLKKMKKK